MNINVIPPFSDDIRLSIDEYRNKLYEMMSNKKSSTSINCFRTNSEVRLDRIKPQNVKARSDSKLTKRIEGERKLKEKQRKISPYVPRFDSYSRSHGIIAQSALIELRASGMR